VVYKQPRTHYTFFDQTRALRLSYLYNQRKNGKIFVINGFTDHIHALPLLPPEISITTLLTHVKASSSKWIKSKKNIDPNFAWQTGYLAISIQGNRFDNVCNYIRNDVLRHEFNSLTNPKTYLEELESILKQQNIEYHPNYFPQSSISKIYVHAIWSTNNRAPYLYKDIRNNLYDRLKETIINNRGIVHAIGGVEDHVHILMEAPKATSLSDLIGNIKTDATHWLKAQDSSSFQNFAWQTGYGAFTMSHSSIENVKEYINGQEEHHHIKTCKEEWDEFLQKSGYVGMGGL
jgi:REP element-mobilizing transposase RayT